MESIIEIFEAIASSDSRDESFSHIVKACEDHKALTLKPSSKIHTIVGHINRKLNSSSSRGDGLQLLKALLPQCSDEVFSENATSWMSQCIKGVESHAKQKTGYISYETLKLLLELAAQLPELTKPVATTIVPKILDLLPSTSREISWSALQCLEVMLRNYGGPCGPNKVVVERFVLSFVDDESSTLVLAAGRCVALFPLMGGGGTGGLNHRSAWLSLQQQLCGALNDILDELFQNITEIQNVSGVGASFQKLAIPEIMETNPSVAVHLMTRRFINLTQFLQCMFRGELPVAKAVLPNMVLGLVCRGLAITPRTLGKKISSEKLALCSVLPQIHAALLKVVRSLIACCGSSLLQYGSVICKLVLQTLKWTSVNVWGFGMDKPYGKLRVEACNTLVDWLVCSKTGSCVELHADQLISILRSEIVSSRPTVTLSVQKAPSKYFSKQQRKMMEKKGSGVECGACDADSSSSSGRTRLVDLVANRELCRAALRALQWIVRAGGLFIQPSVHKSLQETVLVQLLELQRASGPPDVPPPYSSAACRLELYTLLLALTTEAHPSWPAPIQYCLCVLAKGQNDNNIQVSSFCTSALSTVRSIVHPHSPTLEFPKSAEEFEESVATTVITAMHNGGSGSVSEYGENESNAKKEGETLSRKRRSRSPDIIELRKRKRPVSESGKKGSEPTRESFRENGQDDQEITVYSDDEMGSECEEVEETYQYVPASGVIIDDDYFVEEVDDDEDDDMYSYGSKMFLRWRERFLNRYKRERKPSSRSDSPVRIVEIIEEEDLSFKVEERPKQRKKRKEEIGVIDLGSDDAQGSQKSPAKNRKVLSTPEDNDSICIGDESEDGSTSVISSSSSRQQRSTRREMNLSPSPEVIVQVDDSNDDERAGESREEAKKSKENASKKKKMDDSVDDDNEGSDVEEIDLCNDDEEEVEEEEEFDDEENEYEDIAEEEGDDESDDEYINGKSQQSDAVETKGKGSTMEINLIDSENSNSCCKVEQGTESNGKESNEDGEAKKDENKTENKDDNDGSKEVDVEASQEEDTPRPLKESPKADILNVNDGPTVNGTAELAVEADEDEMLASFVDVVQPEVSSKSVPSAPPTAEEEPTTGS